MHAQQQPTASQLQANCKQLKLTANCIQHSAATDATNSQLKPLAYNQPLEGHLHLSPSLLGSLDLHAPLHFKQLLQPAYFNLFMFCQIVIGHLRDMGVRTAVASVVVAAVAADVCKPAPEAYS